MNSGCYVPGFIIALTLALCFPAAGDVITLSDGSKIIGTVERLADGKLTLVTQFAGTLEIDAEQIVSIAVDEPVNIGMKSGDRLVGPIEWKPELDRAVVQTDMGGIPITVKHVWAIWPKDGKSPEELAYEEQIEKVKAEAEAARPKWTATLEFGMVYRDGNTEIFNVRGGGQLQRRTQKDLLRFFVTGVYAEDNQRRNESEVKGGAYYEYLFTERFFAFTRTELEYDEFENLDLRLSTGVGAGYYIIKEDDHELKPRAGIGYLHESYMDDTKRDSVEGEVGFEYRVDIRPWLQFTNASTWFPTFERIEDYRLISDSAFLIPLGDSDAWKLKLGALYEYKAIPAAGRERLDQTYYANIVLELK
jgi:hypothetical protein